LAEEGGGSPVRQSEKKRVLSLNFKPARPGDAGRSGIDRRASGAGGKTRKKPPELEAEK